MHDVSKHHTEEEGEGDHGEYGWVDFFVAGDSVRVNDLLEYGHKVVVVKLGWLL